jgi:anti-anti-sigma factor
METPRGRLVDEPMGAAGWLGATGAVVSSDDAGGESRLRIEGAFDALTVGTIAKAIDAALAERPRRVTVDLDRVRLMDSEGASALVSLRRRVEAQGGSLVLVGARDQPLTILKLFMLDAVLGED